MDLLALMELGYRILGKSRLGMIGSGRLDVKGYSSGLAAISYQPCNLKQKMTSWTVTSYICVLWLDTKVIVCSADKMKDDAHRETFLSPLGTILASCLLCPFV